MPILGKKVFSEDEDDVDEDPEESKKITKKRKKNKEQLSDIVTDEASEKGKKSIKEKDKDKEKKVKKLPKKKAPLDLDRQCGVLIEPTNVPCTRSLTCKIHSMGAKRSVEGRSQAFNDLLANYQKKGIGRPQDQPQNDNGVQQPQQQQQSQEQEPEPVPEPIDSDEETENVRTAIEQNRPTPLSQKQVFYVQRKRKYYKLRDILLEAITPKTV